ncbi:hypothetical protein [uncultured Helicobacter sp.]|uniref:hypothetical protein n=1 Tax=uncultured Helicobacter sp. TaxID=175537 RepID=UPI0037521159
MKKLLHITISGFVLLCFNGCGWGWLVPYSFQPSYHKFKKMCELDQEIYQAKGGKLDEEYYNNLLAYFNTNFEEVLQGNKGSSRQGNSFNKEINTYRFRDEIKNNRQEIILSLKIEKNKITNEILPLKEVVFYVNWYNRRKYLTTKSATSYELEWRENYEDCSYFKKEIK